MAQETTTETKESTEKPGFIKRIVAKVDTAMKEKAETQSQQSSCCGSKDGKGGKCC